MTNTFYFNNQKITFNKAADIFQQKIQLKLSKEAIIKINHCRAYLDKKIAKADKLIYGINTGFGSLCNVRISNSDLEDLQKNLVMSHACGMGEEVPAEVVKLMLFLKIQSLAQGHSGVHLDTVQRLIDFYNHDVLPVVYQQGSLGASGDLAPLAHLCLPLIGMGEVNYQGKKISGESLLKKFNWQPLKLKSKEGLALLNGTQFMSAYASWIIIKAKKLSALADLISAISLEAFDCKLEPFKANIHKIRPHKGQIETAKNIQELLKGSKIANRVKQQVQDPYSFRCIPQVHGASKDALEYVEKVFLTEINSVSDNPNIFPNDDEILSGGNFHGQPLALALDFMAIALSELGSISERRTYQLISGLRGLPPFLVFEPGLNSGFMIPQYTAASIVSQNKQLSTPASIDSIVSSNGQEDHVSMGANGATKAFQVVNNLEKILAVELLTAAQALEYRRPLQSSSKLEKVITDYRKLVPFNKKDRVLFNDLQKTVEFLQKADS